MNHSPAYILREHLISEGIVTDPDDSTGWACYVSALPDGKRLVDDEVAAAIDSPPLKDGRLMGGAPLFHHGVQFLVRAAAYNTGFAKAQAIADALADVANTAVAIESDNYEIASVTQASGVLSLGQEDGTNRRAVFSVNFLATLKEV